MAKRILGFVLEIVLMVLAAVGLEIVVGIYDAENPRMIVTVSTVLICMALLRLYQWVKSA